MHHVIARYAGDGWHCLGCAFHAYAEDLAGVARHAVESQERVAWEVWHEDED